VSLLDGTSVEVLRQRLQTLKGEWEDLKRERGRQVGGAIRGYCTD